MKFPLMFRCTHNKIVEALEEHILLLENALDKADNNDKRDPETGRYTK